MDALLILSVEDSDGDYCIMEMVLQHCVTDLRLSRVFDGEQAVALLRNDEWAAGKARPDLVLLDINLPRVSGLEVLKFMKSQPSTRDIPVVMFTSSADTRDRKKALALGAADYILKPLNLTLITERLTSVCSKYLPRSERAVSTS